MSKIAIISQPDQGVLIDVSGCVSLREAIEHLTNTLQVSSRFWQGANVALNLGQLELNTSQVAKILAIAKGVGATPRQVFAKSGLTRAALREHNVALGAGEPITLLAADASELVEQDIEPGEAQNQTSSADDQVSSVSVLTADLEAGESSPTEPAEGDSASGIDLDFDSQSRVLAGENIVVTDDTASSADASKQAVPAHAVPAVLYLRQTLRSGQTVSHAGHLVIVGDVNPGAEIIAEGDITVWGALRGIAHAGVGGNLEAQIRALKLQPIQIRIAHAIARSPDRPRLKYVRGKGMGPETAQFIDGKIRISRQAVE